MINRVLYGARPRHQCNEQAVSDAGDRVLERTCERCNVVVLCFGPTLAAATADATSSGTTVRILCHGCVLMDGEMSEAMKNAAAQIIASGAPAGVVAEVDAVKLSDVVLVPLSGRPGDA